jgi:hypothetical protein
MVNHALISIDDARVRGAGIAGIATEQDGDQDLNPIDFARTFRSWPEIKHIWSPNVILRGERP